MLLQLCVPHVTLESPQPYFPLHMSMPLLCQDVRETLHALTGRYGTGDALKSSRYQLNGEQSSVRERGMGGLLGAELAGRGVGCEAG